MPVLQSLKAGGIRLGRSLLARPSDSGGPVDQRVESVPCDRPLRPIQALAITSAERAAYESHNAQMMQLYSKHAELIPVMRDPDAFLADMRERFSAQKRVTPDDPYQFDFSDYGVPVLTDMHAALQRELCAVSEQPDDEEHQVGRAFLQALMDDVGAHCESGKVSYRRLQELSYFASSAMGYFDDLARHERVYLSIDNKLEGHKKHSIQELYRAYNRNNGFTLFEKPARFNTVEPFAECFEQGMFNKDKLDMVVLPTLHKLDDSLFMRFMPYPVYFVGVGEKPIPADGFMRPGAQFTLHDYRHSSSIFGRRKAYIEKNHLSEAQVRKLEKTMDLWHAEMNAELPAGELNAAIRFTAFNYHHDSGNPLLPSFYREGPPNRTLRATYAMKEIAGQDSGFGHPRTHMPAAREFLHRFWECRYPAERAIIEAAAP